MRPHKNLLAWKESIELVQMIYEISLKLPADEKFGLVSQIKRAVTSVPLNIAEGAARNTKKEFIQHLFIAEGSLSEVDTILAICINLKYLKQEEIIDTENKMNKVSALVHGLMNKLKNDLNTQSLNRLVT